MSTIQELREAALKDCKQPSRYTSDEGVLDNQEETEKVQAEWDAYFKKMAEIMKLYPYEKERCLPRQSLETTS
jgi:hypothetical protein